MLRPTLFCNLQIFLNINQLTCVDMYRVRPKKRYKPYVRYLWFDFNKTKTRINQFKNTKSQCRFFFQKVIQGQMIVNFVFSNRLVYFFIPILKDIIFLIQRYATYILECI
jgi:hypothetical protein